MENLESKNLFNKINLNNHSSKAINKQTPNFNLIYKKFLKN